MRRARIATACAVWAVLVGVGVWSLGAYQTQAGPQAHAPALWPAASSLTRAAGRSSLVMFVHPECSCSRASLAELAFIMGRVQTEARAQVVFLQSSGADGEVEQSASWRASSTIPSTTRVLDQNGREAERFGAQTSGQLVMYDREGRLRFAGGITGSRGHVGDNLGRQTLLSLLTEDAASLDGHEVFGCSMVAPTAVAGAL